MINNKESFSLNRCFDFYVVNVTNYIVIDLGRILFCVFAVIVEGDTGTLFTSGYQLHQIFLFLPQAKDFPAAFANCRR